MKGLYIIMKGYVTLEMPLAGFKNLPMKILGAGNVLNLDRIIHQIRPQDLSARASTFVTCAFLNTDSFIELARKNHTIRKEILTMQRAINLNSLRPYPLDYFKTRVRMKKRKK